MLGTAWRSRPRSLESSIEVVDSCWWGCFVDSLFRNGFFELASKFQSWVTCTISGSFFEFIPGEDSTQFFFSLTFVDAFFMSLVLCFSCNQRTERMTLSMVLVSAQRLRSSLCIRCTSDMIIGVHLRSQGMFILV